MYDENSNRVDYSLLILLKDGTEISNFSNIKFKEVDKIKIIYNNSVNNIRFGNTRIKELLKINISKIKDMSYMFYGCNERLIIQELSNWDTSNVTNMRAMFHSTYINKLDLSNWDTSNVTDMSYMFYGCSSLNTLDLSNWDTSNVTDMSGMFHGCRNLLTSLDLYLSNWDTSNVTNMYGMFNGVNNTSINLSNWDTSNVTDMSYMFYGCKYLTTLDISNWDTSNVTDMSYMFCYVDSRRVNWNYNGKNYINFTLTEEETGFEGTFPWNKD